MKRDCGWMSLRIRARWAASAAHVCPIAGQSVPSPLETLAMPLQWKSRCSSERRTPSSAHRDPPRAACLRAPAASLARVQVRLADAKQPLRRPLLLLARTVLLQRVLEPLLDPLAIRVVPRSGLLAIGAPRRPPPAPVSTQAGGPQARNPQAQPILRRVARRAPVMAPAATREASVPGGGAASVAAGGPAGTAGWFRREWRRCAGQPTRMAPAT